MNQNVIDIINNYKDSLKKITEEYADDIERMQYEIEDLERDTVEKIRQISEDEKIELLNLLTSESVNSVISESLNSEIIIESLKSEIIVQLSNDTDKIRFLGEVKDEILILKIIKTIADETLRIESLKYIDPNIDRDWIVRSIAGEVTDNNLKIRALEYITSDTDKASIIRTMTDDSSKIEALDHISDEYRANIIRTITDDSLKIKALNKYITSDIDKAYVIETITDDSEKIKLLDYITYDKNKVSVLYSIKDSQKISSLLESDQELKKAFVKSLQQRMQDYSLYDLWGLMKNLELQKEIMPYILFDPKYGIIKDGRLTDGRLTDDMRKDIEEYLGKPIPENIEEMSILLESNQELKKTFVKSLKQRMSKSPYNLWSLMKNLELQNEIIPYILFNSKYEIVNDGRMTDDMRKDIEEYLGKPIPENIEEMSMYERIGVDLDALEGTATCVEELKSLGLDEFQEMYIKAIETFGGPKKEEPKRRVPIRDFAGTTHPNLKDDSTTPETWKELLCGLKRMEENVKKHSEDRLFDPEYEPETGGDAIGLYRIKGKYYVDSNGNHRMTLLKAKYLSEVEMANGDPKRLAEIEEKYTVEVSYVNELTSNTNELIAICALYTIGADMKIRELIENDEKAGYTITEGDRTVIIKSEGELKAYLQEKIRQLRESKDGKSLQKLNKMVEKLKLDYKENEAYREAFETMTGISLENERKDTSRKESARINEFGEIEREVAPEIRPSVDKMHEKEQPEITRPEEESFKDEIGQDEIKGPEQPESRKSDVDRWMNRLKMYNGAIDRVSQGARLKFIQMKSDIISAIKEKIKERLTPQKDQER